MKVPKELIEQWRTEYYRSATPIYLPEYIAYRAAEWALSQPVSMEPVAWKYKVDPSFDGSKWTDVYEITQSKQVADWKAGGSAMPLYSEAQLAAARQQGADEERSKTLDAQDTIELLEMRIDQLEQKNAQLLGALQELVAYCDETGNNWMCTAEARAAIAAAEVKP